MVALVKPDVPSRDSAEPGAGVNNPGFTPIDLDQVPEVENFLRGLGVGDFQRDSVTAPIGRNDTWAGLTESGRKVFVKRLEGPQDDVAGRMRRMLSFEKFIGLLKGDALRSPAFLGIDFDARLVAFEFIESGVSGAKLMVDETFHDTLARAAGEAIAALHEGVPAEGERLDASTPALPSLLLRQGVLLEAFTNFSFAEIEVWRLLQNDAMLTDAIAELCRKESEAPKVPAHCDLRVDQFIIARDLVYITDWEEFRLADGARDVGGFAGEWLYRSVLDIVTSRGDSAFVDLELDHEAVLRRGAEKIARLRPKVQQFWRAYLGGREKVDAEFAERATAFAGWHMLDRMIAASPRQNRISGIEKAAAGIGRKILLEPAKFAATIGLGEEK
ncbi:class IV lanthionine synthetase subunit LxmK [Microbispora sp. NEAU-D428]|uniref:class V lanthionine synthetase subunit LxmK n=1 Tax=Microbispora sitophila TaxID=2771537 RepID=UPI001865B255|nr:class V lanthionine synthetase subunit LxmK [Microbispora sitophila]MBE3008549.1 class IV lanthionine synthetase subunit LxmK [Microbispora sitophila]